MSTTLYYVHDPMCSWCWGFRPALSELLTNLPPEVEVVRLLGGLAPDSDEPMAGEMRAGLQQTWRRIQERIAGTEFNFEFWSRCVPRRSTYPACRAVIAARRQDPALDKAMTYAIQRAYYQEARNPSERDTLIALADEIGADGGVFACVLDAPETREELSSEIVRSRRMGVDGFPSLVLARGGTSGWRVPVEYTDPRAMLDTVETLLS